MFAECRHMSAVTSMFSDASCNSGLRQSWLRRERLAMALADDTVVGEMLIYRVDKVNIIE